MDSPGANRFCTSCGLVIEPANRWCTGCGAQVNGSTSEREAGATLGDTPSPPALSPATLNSPNLNRFCTACGQSISPTNHWCMGCGAPVSDPASEQEPPNTRGDTPSPPEPPLTPAPSSMAVEDMHCPKCGHVDASRNVRGLVSSGTTTGTYSGGFAGGGGAFGGGNDFWAGGVTSGSTQMRTDLALRLASPPQPKSSAGCLTAFLIGCAAFAAFIALLSSNWDTGKPSGASFFCWAVVAVCVILLLLYRSNTDKNLAKRIDVWTPQWNEWARLIYCGRCDLVWHPEQRVPVSPERRLELVSSASTPRAFEAQSRNRGLQKR